MIARLCCMHRFRSLEYSRCVCLWIYKHEPPNNTGFPNSSGRFLGWRVDHLNVPGGVSISKDTLQVWVILKEESSNQRFEDLYIWFLFDGMFRIMHLCRKIPEDVGEDSWSLLSCHSWQLEWGFIMTCMCRWSDAEIYTRVFWFLNRSPRIFRAFFKLIHSIDITCRAAVYSPILPFPRVQALCPRRSETLCLQTWNGWSQMCLRCKAVWSHCI